MSVYFSSHNASYLLHNKKILHFKTTSILDEVYELRDRKCSVLSFSKSLQRNTSNEKRIDITEIK